MTAASARHSVHGCVLALDRAASWTILRAASWSRARGVQTRMAYHSDVAVRRWIAAAPVPPRLQEILAHDPDVRVRLTLAASRAPLSGNALTLLATDPDPDVRAVVARRAQRLPLPVSLALAADPDPDVARWMGRRQD